VQRPIKLNRGTVAVLVIILTVALLTLGGIFAYQYGLLGGNKMAPSQQTINQTEDAVEDRSSEINNVGKEDRVSDIEKDLNSTNVDTLDQEVLGVKAEVEGL